MKQWGRCPGIIGSCKVLLEFEFGWVNSLSHELIDPVEVFAGGSGVFEIHSVSSLVYFKGILQVAAMALLRKRGLSQPHADPIVKIQHIVFLRHQQAVFMAQ